ncbi:MAG TPA: cysteine--tRNA ligase [Candidatus Saccharimonadales bacterium]|nr:cysteine--tRNA ligase [Candidatus Saccharimonadales bacterium]
MKLYNTLTRSTEELVPLNAPTVTMYTCGPTVYDYPHVGNWFTFIRYDVLVRTLTASGLEPKWVMNITDVGHLVSDADEGEDKLEKGARREGKTAWDVAKMYGNYFVAGLDRLNVTKPSYLPKATEHIQEQIDLIRRLEEKGFTYQISDGVYYDTSKFPRYAEFARLDVDEQQVGARVEHNPEKRNSTDFALWKFSPKDQQRDMEWESPWGKGFPGWHLECSAMSMKYLGDTMDVHAGGIDHIPVHHTNEIAQSEAVTGKPVASLWMHANHITVNGDKVSKSLGNGITLEQLEERGYSLAAFRLHVLESHYRSQSKFSWESLEAATNRLKDYQALADLRFQPIEADEYELEELDYEQYQKNILSALQDDLNTPEVLRIVSLIANERHDSIHKSELPAFTAFITFLDAVLGLNLMASQDITRAQKQVIAERQAARDNKDWQKSDELRNELGKFGILVRDTNHGPIWSRA